MNREASLALLLVAVVAAAGALALLAPGALADRTDEQLRPSQLDLLDPSVQEGAVNGQSAELSLDVRLDHRGGPSENVTVEVQAIDSETGMVQTTVRERVGTIEGDREVRLRTNVTVPREGGYRLVTRVYEDGRRVETGSTEIRGVGSLVPEYARTTVDFHSFESGGADLPVISYGVENASNGRARLQTQTYLTNTGDEPAGGLELVLMARQAESNIVADRETVQIGEVEPGRTATPGATLDVPDDYNYHLDAILRKDGVIVGTASSGASLDPSKPVPENETREEVGLTTGDFERTDQPDREEFDDQPSPTQEAGPGFGAIAALAALIVGALALTRRNS